jgi:uncharacterized protein YbjQ (UPF0145 family)
LIASYIGIVRGIVVRAPSIAQGFLGGLKQLVGGNIESYAEVCEAAREEAYRRMVQHAREGGRTPSSPRATTPPSSPRA